jgi:hypothetical protein
MDAPQAWQNRAWSGFDSPHFRHSLTNRVYWGAGLVERRRACLVTLTRRPGVRIEADMVAKPTERDAR